MNKYKNLVWLLLFGSLWGISELLAGGTFYRQEMAYASVSLTAWALLILAMALFRFSEVRTKVDFS